MTSRFTAFDRRQRGSLSGERAATPATPIRRFARQEHRRVEEGFLQHAPLVIQVRGEVRCSAMALFRCLQDADAWTKWLPVDRVVWTSTTPHGVGSTRIVRVLGMLAKERFFVWREGERMAFRVERSTLKPVSAMMEDYRIRRLDDDTCELTWRLAIELKGGYRLLSPLVWASGQLVCQWAMARLARYMSKHGAKYE